MAKAVQSKSKIENFKKQLVASKLKILLPFMLFIVASVVFVSITPALVGISGGRPALWQIASTGVVVILLSSLFIAWVSRILNLRATWALLMAAFLACVAVVKFIAVPQSLYSQEIILNKQSLSAQFDPNHLDSYVIVSIFILLAYVIVLWIYYRVYREKVLVATKVVPARIGGPKYFNPRVITFVVVAVIVAILLCVMVPALILFPLLIVSTPMQYLTLIWNSGGLAMLGLLLVAAIFAFGSVQASAQQSIDMKKPTIIALCIWIALSVLLLYQIIWIVYMTVLVTLAPFKVIYFSSK